MSTLETPRTPHLDLRPVSVGDASYILQLRQDPHYSAHLSPVTGTVRDQERWIETYKTREAQGHEFYYVITRVDDGMRCGLVRIYDISDDSFTWGSWILDQNKPPNAALESALLVYDAGFRKLGCERAVFDVRRENTRTLAFHNRFGARQIGADDCNIYFDYSRARFAHTRPRYLEILTGQRPT